MIAAAVTRLRERVAAAADRAGRDPSGVRVVAAGKYASAEAILEAAAAGITDVGENRAQALQEKYRVVGDAVTWHFLGEIQSNKVRYLDVARLLHSLDRREEAEALQRRGETVGRSWDVLIEVNVSGEPSKQGVRPDDVERLIQDVAGCPLVRLRGLMTIAPQVRDPQDTRPLFAELRRLRDRFGDHMGEPAELSMGMTEDFEVAIEEGSTIVRIGRAIFRSTSTQGV